MTLNFDDVPEDHPHAEAIEWAVHEGLMYGYGDRTFRPEQPITRGQFAAVLHRQSWQGSAAGGESVCDTEPWLCDPTVEPPDGAVGA